MAVRVNDAWDALLAELAETVASSLPLNEVACNFRLTSKNIASHLKHWNKVRLSQPVPPDAFARQWGNELSIVELTLEKRQLLLCLTARSGIITNLEVAIARVGCPLTEAVFNAAAAGGHVYVCEWLLNKGCPCSAYEAAVLAAQAGHTAVVRWLLARDVDAQRRTVLVDASLSAAAGAGHQSLCEELLRESGVQKYVLIEEAANAAARGGRPQLTAWLLEQLPPQAELMDEGTLLASAAYGFELTALTQLYDTWLGAMIDPEELQERVQEWGEAVVLAALRSPTFDWRSKVEWLEGLGCAVQPGELMIDFQQLVTPPDAVERIRHLQRQELGSTWDILWAAMDAGNASVVRHLIHTEDLSERLTSEEVERAAQSGHVDVLAEVVAAAAGATQIEPGTIHDAAMRGHLHVLQWMAGPDEGQRSRQHSGCRWRTRVS